MLHFNVLPACLSVCPSGPQQRGSCPDPVMAKGTDMYAPHTLSEYMGSQEGQSAVASSGRNERRGYGIGNWHGCLQGGLKARSFLPWVCERVAISISPVVVVVVGSFKEAFRIRHLSHSHSPPSFLSLNSRDERTIEAPLPLLFSFLR